MGKMYFNLEFLSIILLIQVLHHTKAPEEPSPNSSPDVSPKKDGFFQALSSTPSFLINQGSSALSKPLQLVITQNLAFIPENMQTVFLTTLRTICENTLPVGARQIAVFTIDSVLKEPKKVATSEKVTTTTQKDTTDILIYKLLSDNEFDQNELNMMTELGVNSKPIKLVINSFLKSLKHVMDAYVARYVAQLEDSSVRIHEDIISYEQKLSS